MNAKQLQDIGRVTRNGALEEAAIVADTFARANLNLNATEPEATIAGSAATAIAEQIRKLKS